MEDTLRCSEESLRIIADTMPALVWTAQPDGKIDYVNQRLIEYAGLSTQVAEEGYFIPIHPDDRQPTLETWEKSLKKGIPYQMEHRLRRYDGQYRWYLCRSTPVRDASGRIIKWYGTSIDIQELRETQEKLAASEAKFRWLFDSNLISAMFWNIDGVVTEANQAFCSMIGCTDEEISSGIVRLQDVTPEEFITADLAAWGEIQAKGSCQPYEKEFINRNNNRRVPVLVSGALLAGSDTNGIAFAIDLSERKRIEEELYLATIELESRVEDRTSELADMITVLREEVNERISAEKSLRESESLLKTVLDTLPVAVWVLDAHAKIIAVNPAAKKVWGEGDGETAIYKAWRHGTDQLLTHEDWGGHKAVAKGETTLGEIYDIESFDNRRKTILYSAVPLKDEHGNLIGAIVVNEDITERIRNDQALQAEVAERLRAIEELRQKEHLLMHQSRLAAMGEMIGNIAHQWRQPLNALGLIVQGLALEYEMGDFNKELLDDSTTKAMQVITHMSRTIDDFRNFFLPDKEKVLFKAREVVTKAVSLVDASFRDQQLSIVIDIREDSMIFGYPNEYSQVILNILMNARDAFIERKPDEPQVRIRLFRENNRAVITVSDNAGGIPQNYINKIFDPYFTTKGPDKGTGIGLFMAKTIIEKNMNGSLTVRNTGKGAEFRIEV
ncbi:MAG TPA: PAS domain S-box protein [Desulfuromonadaceae bacterium]